MTGAAYDYIVVGAGATGSVVAARLSEDGSASVLLIEAGGSDANLVLRVPGLGFAAGTIARHNWNFLTEPVPALNDRRLTFLQGRVMGGSGSMNGMVYTRGHSREYDAWAKKGCTGWSFKEVKPFFLKSEANRRGGQWHGTEGPMRLRPARPDLPICDAFLDAAGAQGLPVVEDINANHPEGVGVYDVNIEKGRRHSAARAFLGPARDRANLTIMRNTQVTAVTLAKGRATGVRALRRGRDVTFSASREVVLCGGAIMSPALLMLSGIGPAEHLRRLGIGVRVDAPAVGENLQNHPCYRPQYACSQPVTARNHVTPLGALRAGWHYLTHATGPLAESFASVGGFFKSNPDLDQADMQVVFLSALPPSGGTRVFDLLPREQGFALTIYQGTPYSRGRVSLRSANPLDPPRIDTGYFTDSRDIEVLATGVQRIRDVMQQPAIARYIRHEIAPVSTVRTRADLIEEIRRNAGTSYHQCGTCAMGEDNRAVLDPALRVRGVKGLRVADTSVMPRMPNAALHAPALMIGEKAAAMILEDAASPAEGNTVP